MRKGLFQLSLILGLISCDAYHRGQNSMEHAKAVEKWQKDREQSLLAPYGWRSLAGLSWLAPEQNTFVIGSSNNCDVCLPPRLPKKLGVLRKNQDAFTFEAAEKNIIYRGQTIDKPTLLGTDETKDFLEVDSVRLYLIKRSKGYAMRIKDAQNPKIQQASPLAWHPISQDYVFSATFVAQPMDIPIPDILGDVAIQKAAGYIQFDFEGKSHKLWALPSDTGLWIIFRDLSSNKGGGSYPSGRFLNIEGPVKEHVTLDFNQAYNPPCAYTTFATCPLPPIQNMLAISLPAGEAYQSHP